MYDLLLLFTFICYIFEELLIKYGLDLNRGFQTSQLFLTKIHFKTTTSRIFSILHTFK